jgi:glutamyl/glutaminyl-tRNA synthetase
MIINAQGKPYSKRDGDAFIGDFQSKGFLGDTLFNYLALLGWSPGDDREIMTREEMIEAFDLSAVRSSPAQMDLRKLLWMNGEYIRAMKPEDFAALARKELSAAGIDPGLDAEAVFALMQPRTKLTADIVPAVTFFFTEDYEYDEKAVQKKLLKDGAFQTLEKIIEIFQGLENFATETIDKALHEFVEQSGLGFGVVMPPIRIAVSGQPSGPDLAPTLAILGKDTVLARIRRTIEQFG